MEELAGFCIGDKTLNDSEPLDLIKQGLTRTFSTTCGKAFRGIGSAFFRFRTLRKV
jgi:hypothetical protein